MKDRKGDSDNIGILDAWKVRDEKETAMILMFIAMLYTLRMRGSREKFMELLFPVLIRTRRFLLCYTLAYLTRFHVVPNGRIK
jgi:hypothetical protein